MDPYKKPLDEQKNKHNFKTFSTELIKTFIVFPLIPMINPTNVLGISNS